MSPRAFLFFAAKGDGLVDAVAQARRTVETVDVEELAFPADGLAQAEISVTSVSLSDPDHARLKVEFRRNDGDWQVKRTDRLRE